MAITPRGSQKLPGHARRRGAAHRHAASSPATRRSCSSLPLLLYQAYAFVLPAFSPRERQVAVPLMVMVPFLFYAGVVFAYFLVLPAAVDFLQNFNDDNYDVLLQARDYNKFAIMVMGVMGLLFQLPVLSWPITRMGIVTPAQLRKHRRYAILVIAIVAALLPGGDPVTMLLMMLPILFLYEGSILLASLLDRRAARARARERREEADRRRARPPSTPTTDALRPQRLRPPPRGQDRVHHARHPDGRRPRAVRHRRRRRAAGRPRRRHHAGRRRQRRRRRSASATQEQAAPPRRAPNPTDAADWAAVARARFNLANSGENVDQSTGNYTDAGAEQLRAAGRAWEEHVELAGDNPDSRVASLMVQAYAGLGDLEKAHAPRRRSSPRTATRPAPTRRWPSSPTRRASCARAISRATRRSS